MSNDKESVEVVVDVPKWLYDAAIESAGSEAEVNRRIVDHLSNKGGSDE